MISKTINIIILILISYNLIYFTTAIKLFPWYIDRPDGLHFLFSILPMSCIILLIGGSLLLFHQRVFLLNKLLPFFMLASYIYLIMFCNLDNNMIAILGLFLSSCYLIAISLFILKQEQSN